MNSQGPYFSPVKKKTCYKIPLKIYAKNPKCYCNYDQEKDNAMQELFSYKLQGLRVQSPMGWLAWLRGALGAPKGD